MKLYGYFRSSASYRVRIALNLKGIPHEKAFVHLNRDGGQQFKSDYLKLNPLKLVPTLIDGDEVINQSLAIIEYLDETHPPIAFLPKDAADRAYVRALALAVACDIHPLNNLRVLNYLNKTLGVTDADRTAWYRHWVSEGLSAIEAMLAASHRPGRYCFGDSPGLADICLVPQIANARRFDCDLSAYPRVIGIDQRLNELKAFADAAPDKQPDAE